MPDLNVMVVVALVLLSFAGPVNAQSYTAPDGVNKCIAVTNGTTTQCTLLGVSSINALPSSAIILKCEDGYEIVIAAQGPMCARELKPPIR
jgi:hypothetical protein